jgi:hypothetical protein
VKRLEGKLQSKIDEAMEKSAGLRERAGMCARNRETAVAHCQESLRECEALEARNSALAHEERTTVRPTVLNYVQMAAEKQDLERKILFWGKRAHTAKLVALQCKKHWNAAIELVNATRNATVDNRHQRRFPRESHASIGADENSHVLIPQSPVRRFERRGNVPIGQGSKSVDRQRKLPPLSVARSIVGVAGIGEWASVQAGM